MKMLKKLAVAAVLSTSLTVQAAPMFRIFELGVNPTQQAEFNVAAKANLVPSVSHEKGTLAMYAVSPKYNPNLAYLFEIYESDAAYQAHVTGDYYKGYLKAAPQILTDHKKFIATEPLFLAEKATPTQVQNGEQTPFVTLVEVKVKPDQADAFKALAVQKMKRVISLGEPMVASYAVTAKDDANHWYFVNLYQDEASYNEHKERLILQQFLQQTESMISEIKVQPMQNRVLMSKGNLRFFQTNH